MNLWKHSYFQRVVPKEQILGMVKFHCLFNMYVSVIKRFRNKTKSFVNLLHKFVYGLKLKLVCPVIKLSNFNDEAEKLFKYTKINCFGLHDVNT